MNLKSTCNWIWIFRERKKNDSKNILSLKSCSLRSRHKVTCFVSTSSLLYNPVKWKLIYKNTMKQNQDIDWFVLVLQSHNYSLIRDYRLCLKQGRISHIGKLGTCLGRQLNRGSTPNVKKIIIKKNLERNSAHPLLSHLIPEQYKLIWYQNNGNFISFYPV